MVRSHNVARWSESVLTPLTRLGKFSIDVGLEGLDRVVKCTIYCTNPSYFPAVNAVYAEYFGDHKPARTFFCPGGWFGPFDIEIDCVALVR